MDVDSDESPTSASPTTPSDTSDEMVPFHGDRMMELAMQAVFLYTQPLYGKIPYHTSALSGMAWVNELLEGHPKRICCELGVHKEVFWDLIQALRDVGHSPSCHITLEEQLSIFLYTSVTGLSIRHVGERFQHANDTISKYFLKMLHIFSSLPFYTDNICLPQVNDPVPVEIRNNTKFYLFFRGAIGAMDGMHINCCPSAAE